MVKLLTEETVKTEVAKGVVAVDCFAEWCGPCKALSPIIEDLATSTTNASVYKLDVDSNPGLCEEFEIMTVPTVLFFKEGKLVKKSFGVKPKEEYVKILEELS